MRVKIWPQICTMVGALCFTGVCLAQTPRGAPQGVTAVIAGRLFDGTSDRLVENQIILIEGDRISEVGARERVKIPSDAKVIDLSHTTVLPGLIDAHTHMLAWPGDAQHPYRDQFLKQSWQYRTIHAVLNAKLDLEAGFTSVRDMGTDGAMYSDVDVRNAINDGVISGPRMQVATRAITSTTCCFIIEGYSPEVTVPTAAEIVDSPDEARKAVREQIKYGADVIKIFETRRWFFTPAGKLVPVPTLTMDEVTAVVSEAHRQFKKVACHVYAGEGLHICIEAGVDSIEHGLDMTDSDVQEMAQKGIFYVPTLYVYNVSSMESRIEDPEARRGSLQQASFRRALAHGVKIVFGTDVGQLPHGTNASEFEYLVKFGMKPVDALRAGTSVAADLMGWQDRVGTLQKGKYADLIAVEGDPLKDISELEHVKFVMKGGQVVRTDLK